MAGIIQDEAHHDPSRGFVAGQAAWVSLGPTTQAEAVVHDRVAVTVHLDALGSRALGLTRLRELLEDARHAARQGLTTRYTGLEALSASRLDLEVLAGYRLAGFAVVPGASAEWVARLGTQARWDFVDDAPLSAQGATSIRLEVKER